ncbi:MAG TPA: acyl-ACP--UDP-N-acetylglucosamine O-acyltransferase [Opitutaceae bacterium]
MATVIHPTAIVDPGAKLGVDCEIQAYAIVSKYAEIGDRCVISSHAVIGSEPQYLGFDPRIKSHVSVGARSVIREFSTINRSIYEGKATTLGEDCFLMTNVHLAHDVKVGKGVVIVNNAVLAGHVTVDDFAFIGGAAAFHQFTRIGTMAMIGGVARVTRDIAPYLLMGERDEVSGLNFVGMKRRGVSREAIVELKNAFREVFLQSGNIRQLAAEAFASGKFVTSEAQRFLAFFTEGKRGFARPTRGPKIEENIDET